MALEILKQLLPEYAKHQKRNIDVLLESEVLSVQQKWGCFLAAAATSHSAPVIANVAKDARQLLNDDAVEAILACATTMTVNNYGFRAKGWLGEDFDDIRFGLRTGVHLKPGVSAADYELWAITVSVVNGCEHCVQAHSQDAQEAGLSPEQIWEAVKIASVVQAIAHTIAVEQSLNEGDAGS